MSKSSEMTAPEREHGSTGSKTRFTISGTESLETRLADMCQSVLIGVQQIIPAGRLQLLVLGGGYGRGQGGVLRTDEGDKPYNDLEFYVFVRGNLFLAERRHRVALQELGEHLSPEMGLHVEFKLYSLEKLRRGQISMYSYDLVAGHKIIYGGEKLFRGCEHHLAPEQIPASEATRLLFNRCSGLLLVRNLLRSPNLNPEQSDFIGRNLAKAQLGFGDAILTLFGLYHWDCRERHERLNTLKPFDPPSWLSQVRHHHAEGVLFKLHPQRATNSRDELGSQFAELHELGRRIWLWIEGRRLNRVFKSARDYSLNDLKKCPDSTLVRNCLLNLKTYGPRAPFTGGFSRYPREKLFNALTILLWDDNVPHERAVLQRLQNQLRARSTRWEDLISAYMRLWQTYG
ncbi:MAG TPA: hypothetical protein VG754_08385 [Verrucomicrobiae bacterium]|nr:hypothetical protein [Verrucomicrobiae bacterium]